MNVPYRIVVGKKLSQKEQEKVEQSIENYFSHINEVYNNWNPNSEISKLSCLKAQEKCSLSPELNLLLLQVDELYRKSHHRFDVTLSPILAHYKHGKEKPDLDTMGWEKIHLENGYFWKEHDSTTFDLCAIAKGFAVDLLTESLSFENLYVEWGGEIRVKGNHPSGRKWKIGIEKIHEVLELSNMAIATSGDYQQYWEEEGVEYFHIIDPYTKRPLIRSSRSISSATVIAPTCALADALATILMLFASPEEAGHWLQENYPEAQCYLLTNQ